MQHLNQRKYPKINPQVGPKSTTTIWSQASNHPTLYRTIKSPKNLPHTCKTSIIYPWNGKNHLELAITIDQHLNQGISPKINPQVGPEIYHYNISQARTIQHSTESRRTKFNLPQLCKTSHNYPQLFKNSIERAIPIIQYLNQGRFPKINSQVMPVSTITIWHRQEPSKTVQNHQGP